MKEYSKGIYMKFKPEEVEILHDRMKEAGVQNMSAYIRKIQKRESELIKSVSVALRFIRSSRGLGHSQQAKTKGIFTERVPLSYACYGTFTALFLGGGFSERNGMERTS